MEKSSKSQHSESKQQSDSQMDIHKIMNIVKNDDELAKSMLARLSGTDTSKLKKNDTQFDLLDSFAKPAWIESVKKTHKTIIDPEIQKREDLVSQLKPIKIQTPILNTESEKNERYCKDYPFFSIVKRIMYANGDFGTCLDDSVIAMHKSISHILDVIFDQQLVNKYLEHDNKIGKKSEKSSKNKASKFKKFLSKIYSQEYFKFFQFTKIAKNVEKLDFDLENQHDADESKLFNYESDEDSDDGLSFKLINSNIKEEERQHFNHQRMDKMNEEEYLHYVNCRSTNFLSEGKDKFIAFLELERRGFGYLAKNKNIIEFLGYIFTRKVGGTIENIIRQENHGVLRELLAPIDVKQIESEAEKHINSLKAQMRKVLRDSMSIEEVAFRLFQKEYKDFSYGNSEKLENGEKSIKQIKREESFVSSDSKSEQKNDSLTPEWQPSTSNKSSLKGEWRKLNVATRKQWIDRVIAEKQVKELIDNCEFEQKDWDDIDPINTYAEYLINNMKSIKDKTKIDDQIFRELFHRYCNNGALIITSEDGEKIELDNHKTISLEKKIEIKQDVKETGTTNIHTNASRKRRLESIFE